MEFNNILEVVQYFKNNKTCLEYLAVIRCGQNLEILECPYCEYKLVYKYKDGCLRCTHCKKKSLKKQILFFRF